MRKNIDEYFIEIAKLAGERGTCQGKYTYKGKNGCVITRDGIILSVGYVGSPSGAPHCDEVGHQLDENGSCIRTTHAEQNAIINAARTGTSILNGKLYCTTLPCYTCAKMIINSGIKEVICSNDYHKGQMTKDLFKELNISFKII